MRDSVDSFLTAYTHEGSDPVGYPYGDLPQYTPDDIPMAETAYGAGFGDLGRHRHHGHHHGRGRGFGPWGYGPGWGYPYYPYPFEVVGTIVESEPIILDEAGEMRKDEEEKKKKDKTMKDLPSFAVKRLHDVAVQLPVTERRMFMRELQDTKFAVYISRFLSAADPVQAIRDDALRAIANEFTPRMYPLTRGYWNYLRGVAGKVASDTVKMIEKQVAGMSPEERIATARKYQEVGMSGGSGLGWVEELITGVATAAGSIYIAGVVSGANKDIAKIQAAAAVKQAELQLKMAQAQIAMQQAGGMVVTPEGRVVPASSISKPFVSAEGVAGIPWWGVIVGAGVLGAGVYLATK